MEEEEEEDVFEDEVERAPTPAPTKKNKIKKELEGEKTPPTKSPRSTPPHTEHTQHPGQSGHPGHTTAGHTLTPKHTTHTDQPPTEYTSPVFDDVEKEFKDQLLSFTTDTLLQDLDLLKNIADRGNKILFHAQQLKQLIAILYLSKEDRPKY
jgi:hypothetical protein